MGMTSLGSVPAAAFGAVVGFAVAVAVLAGVSRSSTLSTVSPLSQPINFDRSVFAGVSPETGRPIHTTPNDAPLTYSFNKAKDACAALDAHGRKDWRIPTKVELNILFDNRAAVGGFDRSGLLNSGWYWSSSTYGDSYVWVQRFIDGLQSNSLKDNRLALRCVRG